jgi:hypothetical protein
MKMGGFGLSAIWWTVYDVPAKPNLSMFRVIFNKRVGFAENSIVITQNIRRHIKITRNLAA